MFQQPDRTTKYVYTRLFDRTKQDGALATRWQFRTVHGSETTGPHNGDNADSFCSADETQNYTNIDCCFDAWNPTTSVVLHVWRNRNDTSPDENTTSYIVRKMSYSKQIIWGFKSVMDWTTMLLSASEGRSLLRLQQIQGNITEGTWWKSSHCTTVSQIPLLYCVLLAQKHTEMSSPNKKTCQYSLMLLLLLRITAAAPPR